MRWPFLVRDLTIPATMNAIPVLLREVRSEARQPWTYWLRVCGVAAVLGTSGLALVDTSVAPSEAGRRAFGLANSALLLAIWLFVPLLTADCLSRERREGTLGLLVLTPLGAAGVVLAKSLVQMIRALTMLLAVMPIFTFVFLLGGVGWIELANAVCLDLASMVLALAAGLLASSRATRWSRAAVAALGWSLALAVLFANLYLLAFWQVILRAVVPVQSMPPVTLWVQSWLPALANTGGTWSAMLSSFPPTIRPRWMMLAVGTVVVAVLLLAWIISTCARRIASDPEVRSDSLEEGWFGALFLRPFLFRGFLRRQRAWSLEWNPIGWLQERTTTARLTKWGWCLGLVVAEAWCLGTQRGGTGFLFGQGVLAICLAAGIAFSAAGSFREERSSGALELILVSPVSEGRVIRGRLLGLYSQFFPAMAVLGMFMLVAPNLFGSPWVMARQGNVDGWSGVVLAATTLAALPVIGLYHSLSSFRLWSAWARTLLWGLAVPWVLGVGVWLASGFPAAISVSVSIAQGCVTWAAWNRLKDDLRVRRFVESPAESIGIAERRARFSG